MPVLVAFPELAWGVRLQWQVDGPMEDSHENLYTFGSGSGCEAADAQRMRRVLEDGRHLGASAILPGVRARGLLRFVEEQACYETLPSDEAPDHEVVRARRELGLLLHRRS